MDQNIALTDKVKIFCSVCSEPMDQLQKISEMHNIRGYTCKNDHYSGQEVETKLGEKKLVEEIFVRYREGYLPDPESFDSIVATNPDYHDSSEFSKAAYSDDYYRNLTPEQTLWLDAFQNDYSGEDEPKFDIYEKIWYQEKKDIYAAVVIGRTYNYNAGENRYDLKVAAHNESYIDYVPERQLRSLDNFPVETVIMESPKKWKSEKYYSIINEHPSYVSHIKELISKMKDNTYTDLWDKETFLDRLGDQIYLEGFTGKEIDSFIEECDITFYMDQFDE